MKVPSPDSLHTTFGHAARRTMPARPAGLLGGPLDPGRLVLETLLRAVGLHIDRLDDAIAGEVVEIFAERIVATDRFVGTEDARLHWPDQPGKIGLTPYVMMRIDD